MHVKLLIVAGNPGLLASTGYNGGGWIGALQQELQNCYSDSLDMALVHFSEQYPDTTLNGCRYYTVPLPHKTFWNYERKESVYKLRLQKVVEKENPDVILCFGTEMPFGLIQDMTNVPVLMHLQGLLTPIYEFLLPHGMSWLSYVSHPRRAFGAYMWKRNAARERRILKNIRYVLGRTEWDKRQATLFAPQASYFYCSEMLRPAIYDSPKVWKRQERPVRRIISIISKPFYKGADMLLRTALVLKTQYADTFQWDVYGISQAKEMERLSGVNHADVNVNFRGVISAEQLVEAVCQADVFVHPSYIENSPNTVCEAQLLGIPVVATNVGGTSSIVNHNETGLLVPANDIYLLAADILELFRNADLSQTLGAAGRKAALKRHNPSAIAHGLMDIINQVKARP